MFRFLIITNVNIYVTFKVFDLYSSLRTVVALLQKSQWSGDFWGRALSQSCSKVSALCNTPSILLHSDHYHAITQNSPVSSSPGATLKPVPRPLPSCAPPLPSPLGSTALEWLLASQVVMLKHWTLLLEGGCWGWNPGPQPSKQTLYCWITPLGTPSRLHSPW